MMRCAAALASAVMSILAALGGLRDRLG